MANDPWMIRMGLRRRPEETFVASGQLVDLKSADAVQSILRRRDRWQYQALDALEACGELSYTMFILSGLMSRLTLFGAEFPEDSDAEPIRTDNQQVIDIVYRLGTPLQRAEIQRELTTALLVPAEGYLVGLQPSAGRDNTEELWEIRSIDEVEESGSGVILRDSPHDEHPIRLNPDIGDTFIRIWRRHPRWKSLAFSPIKPLLDDIDQLLWWKAASAAAAKNRLTLAGALGIPQNLETPSESEEDARLSGSDRFVKRIYEAAKAAITNPGSGAASIPIFYTYPPNDSGKSGLDYLSMDRPQDDFLENRINQITDTVKRGLPIPSEVVSGLGNATHWGGGQIEEGLFSQHLEPTAVLLVSSLTTAFMQPILRKSGVSNPSRYLFWYDNSNLVVHRDMGQASDKGVEYGAVSLAAWRRERGFSERDAPSEQERAEMMEWLRGLRGREEIRPQDMKTPADSDPNKTPQENPVGERTTEGEDRAAPARGKGQPILSSANSSNGHSDELISRLQVFSDATIRRALERAGNKLRSRAAKFPEYRKTLTSVPGESVAAHLGPKLVEKLDTSDLFDGCFNYVPGRVEFIVHNTLPDARLHTLAASAALSTLLHETCKRHLYNPPTEEYLISESDLTTVVSKLTGEK